MRERCERPDHRQSAHVALAEVGFQSPDRHQNLPGHAEPRLDARQQRRVALQHRPPAIDAPGADAGRDILLERFVEGVALAAVEIQNRRILAHPAERRADHARRDAGSLRIRRHARDEGVEIAAAAGGVGGGGEGKDKEDYEGTEGEHVKANPSGERACTVTCPKSRIETRPPSASERLRQAKDRRGSANSLEFD